MEAHCSSQPGDKPLINPEKYGWLSHCLGQDVTMQNAQVDCSSRPMGAIYCGDVESVADDQSDSMDEKAPWAESIPDKPWTYPEIQGWLSKDESKFSRKQVRRWVVLKQRKLYWFRTSDLHRLSVPCGTIKCKEVTSSNGKSCFVLNKDFRFYACSSNERKEWIDSIRRSRA